MQVFCGVSAEKHAISAQNTVQKSPKTHLTVEKRTLTRENHLQPESVEEAFNLVCRLILQDF